MGPHRMPETRGCRPARGTEVDCIIPAVGSPDRCLAFGFKDSAGPSRVNEAGITHRRPRQCSVKYWTWPLQYEYLQIPRSGLVQFKIGDRVVFQAEGGRPVEGMLTRYNRKTVTVITDDGRQWNVSPALLSKAVPATSKAYTRSNVVSLK